MRASVLGSWLEPQILKVIVKRRVEHGESAVGDFKLRVFHIYSYCGTLSVQGVRAGIHERIQQSIFLSKGNVLILEAHRRYLRLRLAFAREQGPSLRAVQEGTEGPRGRGATSKLYERTGVEAQVNCGVQRPDCLCCQQCKCLPQVRTIPLNVPGLVTLDHC